ncbi:MAG TPA: hypothetical protein VH437_01700 [Terriglobales bacterium]|jgi:hypothetical protein
MTPRRKLASGKLTTRETSLPQILDRRLFLYTLAAGSALAAAPASHAEVIFTRHDASLLDGGTLNIDMDNDGASDFRLILSQPLTYSHYRAYANLRAYGAGSNWLGANGSGFAEALKRTARIGDGRRFAHRAIMATDLLYRGEWLSVTDRFLGVRFLIDGENHYGWIGFRRVRDFAPGQMMVVLAGYAYETVPNKTIVAGDRGDGGPTFQPTSLAILSSGHTGIGQRRERNAH